MEEEDDDAVIYVPPSKKACVAPAARAASLMPAEVGGRGRRVADLLVREGAGGGGGGGGVSNIQTHPYCSFSYDRNRCYAMAKPEAGSNKKWNKLWTYCARQRVDRKPRCLLCSKVVRI